MQRFEPNVSADPSPIRRTWKVLRGVLPLVGAAALISACSLIPPQEVNDPLGLNGEELAVAFVGVTSAGEGFGAQAVAGDASGTFDFADLGGDIPLNPGTLSNPVSIASAKLGPATEADAPDVITLSDAVLTIRVWQGAATYEVAEGANRVEHVLTVSEPINLNVGSCFAGSCSYTLDGDGPAFGAVNLSGSPLSTLLDIAFNAPSPNHGSATLTVQGEPDELAGKTLTLTLAAATGTVSF